MPYIHLHLICTPVMVSVNLTESRIIQQTGPLGTAVGVIFVSLYMGRVTLVTSVPDCVPDCVPGL